MTRFIEQLPYCEGANNHMGSLATTDEEVMNFVMAILKNTINFFWTVVPPMFPLLLIRLLKKII